MKEIDFIPQWYKDRQKQQVSYHTQYVVIIAVFAALVLWSFGTCISVSKAKAQIKRIEASLAQNADLPFDAQLIRYFRNGKAQINLVDLQLYVDAMISGPKEDDIFQVKIDKILPEHHRVVLRQYHPSGSE